MSSDLPRTVHQMASYAAYHLSEQATGGHAWTEAQVEHELRQIYPTAPASDIEAALHFGRESVNAAEAYRDDKEGRTLSEATGIPEDMPVKVYFRLQWGYGKDAEYKIFAVEATGGSGLVTLGERAKLMPQQLSEEYDYPIEAPDETILFKVDFFNDP